jgi:phosphate:Na+ symporter
LLGGNQRYGYFGTALAGFGLFFIGIDVLKDAFVGITEAVDIAKFTLHGVSEVFTYLGIGFLMTVLTQSSSAAIAITLTAASGGVLGLYAAASMVIGANVGTTSTAVISVIGATSNAKRVATAHVVFNIITALIALLMLPVLFKVVSLTRDLLELDDIPAVTLALFHTVFNILGLLIMWPFTHQLANFLKKQFVTQEEIESRPQYLDKTIAASPDLAINALVLEVSRTLTIVRRMALMAVRKETNWANKLSKDYAIVEKVFFSISEFIAHFEKASLTDDVTLKLSKILRAQQHLSSCADEALELGKLSSLKFLVKAGNLDQSITQFRKDALKLFNMADITSDSYQLNSSVIQLDKLQNSYDQVKSILLESGAKQIHSINDTMSLLEENVHIRRMARQLVKTLKDLDNVQNEPLVKPISEAA